MSYGLYSLDEAGKMKVFFHPGQYKLWQSTQRFVVALAGTQGGKTSFGPIWFHREMMHKGPGDYMIVTPTYPLLEKKLLPEFRRLFDDLLQLGKVIGGSKEFRFSDEGCKRLWPDYNRRRDGECRVLFGHASNPESLESATAKAAWLDEAGQNQFKLDSWEAILRRLSLARGRVLITTTIYNLGWLKKRLYDPWKAGEEGIDVVQFESIMNPVFPIEEWRWAKSHLPAWKFNMFYKGLYDRPAGMIYSNFDEELHECPRFKLPVTWKRFMGLDFGGVNMAAVYYAQHPESKQLFMYRTYKAGNMKIEDHVKAMLKGEPMMPYCIGGSKSEGQWREEFKAAGLPVRPPVISDVEVGISRVFAAHEDDMIVVFDDEEGYLDEKMSYSRPVDKATGEPMEGIEDKETYHFMDSERYIISYLNEEVDYGWGENPMNGHRG